MVAGRLGGPTRGRMEQSMYGSAPYGSEPKTVRLLASCLIALMTSIFKSFKRLAWKWRMRRTPQQFYPMQWSQYMISRSLSPQNGAFSGGTTSDMKVIYWVYWISSRRPVHSVWGLDEVLTPRCTFFFFNCELLPWTWTDTLVWPKQRKNGTLDLVLGILGACIG